MADRDRRPPDRVAMMSRRADGTPAQDAEYCVPKDQAVKGAEAQLVAQALAEVDDEERARALAAEEEVPSPGLSEAQEKATKEARSRARAEVADRLPEAPGRVKRAEPDRRPPPQRRAREAARPKPDEAAPETPG